MFNSHDMHTKSDTNHSQCTQSLIPTIAKAKCVGVYSGVNSVARAVLFEALYIIVLVLKIPVVYMIYTWLTSNYTYIILVLLKEISAGFC